MKVTKILEIVCICYILFCVTVGVAFELKGELTVFEVMPMCMCAIGFLWLGLREK